MTSNMVTLCPYNASKASTEPQVPWFSVILNEVITLTVCYEIPLLKIPFDPPSIKPNQPRQGPRLENRTFYSIIRIGARLTLLRETSRTVYKK